MTTMTDDELRALAEALIAGRRTSSPHIRDLSVAYLALLDRLAGLDEHGWHSVSEAEWQRVLEYRAALASEDRP